MTHNLPRDLALLLARVALGVVFVAHGWQKHNDIGIDGVEAYFTGEGVPLARAAAYFATYVELAGGAMLIAGLLTPLVGLLLFADMVGAFVFVHVGNGVFIAGNGFELVAALGAGAVTLAAVGAGRLSADSFLSVATGGRIPGLRM